MAAYQPLPWLRQECRGSGLRRPPPPRSGPVPCKGCATPASVRAEALRLRPLHVTGQGVALAAARCSRSTPFPRMPSRGRWPPQSALCQPPDPSGVGRSIRPHAPTQARSCVSGSAPSSCRGLGVPCLRAPAACAACGLTVDRCRCRVPSRPSALPVSRPGARSVQLPGAATAARTPFADLRPRSGGVSAYQPLPRLPPGVASAPHAARQDRGGLTAPTRVALRPHPYGLRPYGCGPWWDAYARPGLAIGAGRVPGSHWRGAGAPPVSRPSTPAAPSGRSGARWTGRLAPRYRGAPLGLPAVSPAPPGVAPVTGSGPATAARLRPPVTPRSGAPGQLRQARHTLTPCTAARAGVAMLQHLGPDLTACRLNVS